MRGKTFFYFTKQIRVIVTYKEEGWHIVTQRAHGIVAAGLAMAWRHKDRPGRWTETVLAIAEHDDAEVELDGKNILTPTGGPINFDMTTFDLAQCRKLSMLTQTKSRLIALLTSLHMVFLYGKEAAKNKEAHAFFAEQKRLQEGWAKELGMEKEEYVRLYDLLEWCDACSLLICQEKQQPEKRKMEISVGPDKKMYHLVQVDEATLTVEPWPFEAKTFTVSFEWRLIKQLQFSSSAQFREAFQQAAINETKWTVQAQKVAAKRKKVNL